MAQYGLLPPQNSYGLLGYDEKQSRLDAFLSGLGNTSAALLAAGAPSTDPGNFGKNMARVAPGFAQGYQGSMQDSRNRAFQDMQAQAQQQQMAAQKQQMERAQQAQLAQDRYINSVTMPNGPTNTAAQGQNTPMGLLAQAAPEQFIQASVQNAMTPKKPIAVAAGATLFDPQTQRAVYQAPAVPEKVTPYTDMAKLNRDYMNGLIPKKEYNVQKASLLNGGGMDPTKEWYTNAEGQTIRTPKGVENAEEKWRTRLKPTIDGLQEINRKMAIVEKSLDAGNGTGDIAAINAYQRMIDDGVVRSEDVRLQAEAMSLIDRVEVWKANKQTGEILPQQLRERMREVARALANETIDGYQKQATAWKSVVDDSPGLQWGRVFPAQFDSFMEKPGNNSIPNSAPSGTVGENPRESLYNKYGLE